MIYDPFQKKAIDYIKDDYSVIVSAPTGAGKTIIAEYVIKDCLAKGSKVIYTAPIKALSNQKYRDFREGFKDKIGILTGDVSINPHAPVLIMTTEIFRNKLFEDTKALEDYSWIIFDEVHYLDDYERGTVWEESLIFLPEHMNMLALSATIPNIDELAQWFLSIHKRPLKIIKENKRPVPLHFFYQYNGKITGDIQQLSHIRHRTTSHKTKPNRPTALIEELAKTKKLPCIYFVFGRRRSEYLAEDMLRFDFLTKDEKAHINKLYAQLCEKHNILDNKSSMRLKILVEKGIAYHHAGMLPALKEIIEQLFTSKLIKVIFTTETFALGINMPARSVIFDELSKFYGRFYSPLKTRDFYQMAGRAGRRGIDEEGFIYSRINPRDLSFRELKKIIYGEPDKVSARFNASYATILNLYEKYAEKIYDVYPRSFHYFQQGENKRLRARELLRSKIMILENMGYLKDGSLTDKGRFAGNLYGYELPLAEIYEKGILEKLSEFELGELALAFVYEPRKGAHRPHLAKSSKKLSFLTEDIVHRIHRIEKRFNINSLSKKCFFHLTPCLMAWMNREKFERITRYTNADEGEIIRNFRMSIQILREIIAASFSQSLKNKTKNTIMLINRGIIDAEKQLKV